MVAAEFAVRALAPAERPPPSPPVPLGEVFSPEEVRRGRAFSRPQMALGLTRDMVRFAALVRLARRPPRRLDSAGSPEAGAAALGAGLAVGLTATSLPISALGRWRALAAGLATQSWAAWAADAAKATGLGAGFAGGAGAAVVWTIRRHPRDWWARAAGGSIVAGSLLAALAPVVLDPLFNRFDPLDAGPVRDDVFALARDAGVRVREVYAVDASRRTTAANAYVTGFGPTKRVVIFDTLLDRYSRAEIRGVVAHELAHVKGRDVPRGLLFTGIVALPTALAVRTAADRLHATAPLPSSLPGLALAAAVAGAPLELIGNRLSRMLERRADAFALRLTDDPDAFISFERKITLQNLGDPAPPAWLNAVLATHPSTSERIGMARAFAAARAG